MDTDSIDSRYCNTLVQTVQTVHNTYQVKVSVHSPCSSSCTRFYNRYAIPVVYLLQYYQYMEYGMYARVYENSILFHTPLMYVLQQYGHMAYYYIIYFNTGMAHILIAGTRITLYRYLPYRYTYQYYMMCIIVPSARCMKIAPLIVQCTRILFNTRVPVL